MKRSLHALSCFNHIEHISEIASGLSQQCLKINADNKVYFAKTISGDTETQIALSTAKQRLSPAVFYHDRQWLITDFIEGGNLAQSAIGPAAKINHAMKLMAQCHQFNIKPAELTPSAIIDDLITKTRYSTQQKKELYRFADSILPPLSYPQKLVCCHGDLNFSNVLIDQNENTWLVDYECACTAPTEFDLAMFIAVNNITETKISMITEQYEHQCPSTKINRKLLYHYLAFSYFINSLWYSCAYQSRSDIKLLHLHQGQWQKFMSLMGNDDASLPTLKQ